jgi:F-type H+-transporting ATPase subunit epsilon
VANSLKVTIVSASQSVWSGEAVQVSARTVEGEIGILAGHEPVLAILAPGQVRVTTDDGQQIVAQADDGFLSVESNTVTVVSRVAELV